MKHPDKISKIEFENTIMPTLKMTFCTIFILPLHIIGHLSSTSFPGS